MIIAKYGITLERLSLDDLELVRNWRNADHVRLNMKFQHLISTEMQLNWFSNLDINCNYYFIIKDKAKKIGIVNLKEIDWLLNEAEAGIFIGELDYLNTVFPMLATICIMEFAFDELKINTLKAKIASNNVKVILFNESIGYKKCEEQNDINFHYYSTNSDLFKSAIKNIRNTLDKLN